MVATLLLAHERFTNMFDCVIVTLPLILQATMVTVRRVSL